MLMQITFDIYDTNQDSKISELDLFKLNYNYNQSTHLVDFNKIFNIDLCQMVRFLKNKNNLRYNQILIENQKDDLYVQRLLNWRNLQLQDKMFDRKK